jgi:hypothetical protein
MAPSPEREWRYQGPSDPKEGGHWYHLEGWEHGYAEAVRVIDLTSACGFRGAVLVEALVVLLPETDEELTEYLQAIGLTPSTLPQEEGGRKAAIVDACLACGRHEPANTWPEPQSEVLQLQDDPELGPMRHDGWQADRRMTDDLTEHVARERLPRL